jgi:diguanylate cyclase (GGDEF)-like protein
MPRGAPLPDAYRIDRLTAEFVFPETEQAFRASIKTTWVHDTRQTIFLAAVFYLLFAITDYMVMGAGPDYTMVLLNRVIVCAVGISAALTGMRLWSLMVNGFIPTLVMTIAMAAFVINVTLIPLDYGVHGMGMMLMLWGVYAFIPNRFIASLAISIAASLAFMMVTVLHFGLALGSMATLMVMLLVTNILGGMVSWRGSVAMREAYCGHAVLSAANDRLEREAVVRGRLEDELRQRADRDDTTGVANRAALFELASRLCAEADATRGSLSLLLIDIDYFKQINGTYGHMRGDEVLRALVGVCRSVLERPHFLARLGGEEFVVLLPETAQVEATRLAERVRAECQRAPVAIAEVAIHFTVCVGVAQRLPGEGLNILLRRADEAVSAAKYKGRNRVEAAA